MDGSFLFRQSTDESKLDSQLILHGEMPTVEACLKAWRELDGTYRFVLDGDGAILACDEHFFEIGVGGADFTRNGAHMRPRDRQLASRFDRLFQAANAAVELLPRASGGHWICQSLPFAARPKKVERTINPLRFALSIRPAGGDAHGQWADLRSAFGLTETEERVLQLMVSGESVADVAKREKVSINTVRTHVRHIHEKLAISDAYELWVRVADYRL